MITTAQKKSSTGGGKWIAISLLGILASVYILTDTITYALGIENPFASLGTQLKQAVLLTADQLASLGGWNVAEDEMIEPSGEVSGEAVAEVEESVLPEPVELAEATPLVLGEQDAVTGGTTSPMGGNNLLRNSSFESADDAVPRFWNYQHNSHLGNTFTTPEAIRSGDRGLKFKPDGNPGFGISQPDIKLREARAYTFSVYVKAVNASASTVKLSFWDSENNKYGSSQTFSVSGTKDWYRISTKIDNSSNWNGKKWFPIIEVFGLSSGAIYMDDAQLQEGTVLGVYRYGDGSGSAYYAGVSGLGDGSVLVTNNGVIYPTKSGTGGLGTSSNTFESMYLKSASINKDGGLTVTGITNSGSMTVNARITFGNSEYIDNATDDIFIFGGAGGTDNTDLYLDLDGAYPVLYSNTDGYVGIDDDLQFVGAQSIITSSGDLTLNPAGGVNVGGGTALVVNMGSGDDLFVTDDLEIYGGVATMSAATNAFTGKALAIQSSDKTTLTLGGATTGNILIQPSGDTGDYIQITSDGTDLTLATTDSSILNINPAGNLVLNPGSGVNVGGGTPLVVNMATGDDLFVTDDLEIYGGVATMSAAANAISGDALTVGAAAMTTLTLGGGTTGNIVIQPSADTGDYIQITSDGTDLTLATTDASILNITPAGNLVLNSGGSLDIDDPTILLTTQATNIDLVNTTVGALTIETNLLTVDTANTRVGVGTATPLLGFHVSASADATAAAIIENTSTNADADGLAIKMGFTGDGSVTNNWVTFLDGDGDIHGKIHSHADATLTYATNGIDFAEYFIKSGDLTIGQVVCLASGGVRACQTGESTVVGIVSEHPGFAGGVAGDNKALVALVGQVPVQVSGSVEAGDYLAAGPNGTAVKATGVGMVVGMALESGSGQVLAFVNPTYYDPVLAMLGVGSELNMTEGEVLGVTDEPVDVAEVDGTETTEATELAVDQEPVEYQKLIVTEAAEFQGTVTVASLDVSGSVIVVGDVRIGGELNIAGAMVTEFTAGQELAAGDAVAISGANTVVKANGQPAIGVASQAAGAGSTVKVAIAGKVSGYASLAVGSRYYVGPYGSVTTEAKDNRQVIGVAVSSDTLLVMPSLAYEAEVKAEEPAAPVEPVEPAPVPVEPVEPEATPELEVSPEPEPEPVEPVEPLTE